MLSLPSNSLFSVTIIGFVPLLLCFYIELDKLLGVKYSFDGGTWIVVGCSIPIFSND